MHAKPRGGAVAAGAWQAVGCRRACCAACRRCCRTWPSWPPSLQRQPTWPTPAVAASPRAPIPPGCACHAQAASACEHMPVQASSEPGRWRTTLAARSAPWCDWQGVALRFACDHPACHSCAGQRRGQPRLPRSRSTIRPLVLHGPAPVRRAIGRPFPCHAPRCPQVPTPAAAEFVFPALLHGRLGSTRALERFRNHVAIATLARRALSDVADMYADRCALHSPSASSLQVGQLRQPAL